MLLADSADTLQGKEAMVELVLCKSQLSGHVFQQEGLPKACEQGNLQTKSAVIPSAQFLLYFKTASASLET